MAAVATEGILTVDLGAIVANWRALTLRHGAPCAAVVKADAYGLGAAPVARALAAAGCRHFFVALPAEGRALRAALGEGPLVAVLGGFAPGTAPGCTPVLNTLAAVAAHGAGILHLDTGLARLGLPPEAWGALPEGFAPALVMTHLACADTPDHPLNATQLRRFRAARSLFPGVPGSLAASSGLFLGEGFDSDLGRPGAALYGLNPIPGRPNPMRPAVRLEVPILQTRRIAAGTPVGYGAAWVAARPSLVATVACGYADGYLRALSGRGMALLQGRPVPLIGRVSMDLLTFDVTDHPAAAPGTLLTLLGDALTPDAVAATAGTIGYELLTALGGRYARRYLAA
jgi:alanine racemase